MPNWAYTNDAAATTYQGDGGVMGSSDLAYGMPGMVHGKAHLSVIGIVLFAVLGLIALDKGGLKFVVLAGRK